MNNVRSGAPFFLETTVLCFSNCFSDKQLIQTDTLSFAYKSQQVHSESPSFLIDVWMNIPIPRIYFSQEKCCKWWLVVLEIMSLTIYFKDGLLLTTLLWIDLEFCWICLVTDRYSKWTKIYNAIFKWLCIPGNRNHWVFDIQPSCSECLEWVLGLPSFPSGS